MKRRRVYRPITATGLYWTLGALMLAAAPHTLYMPFWPLAAAGAATAWRWLAYRRGWPLPSLALRVALALGGFAAVLIAYRTFSGLDAGNALLVVMMALKLTETRTSRDLSVLLFIALFLVVTAYLHEQSPWLAAYTVPVVWIITTALLQVSRRGPALPAWPGMRISGTLLAQAVPVMLVLFVLFPRLPGPFWALPQSASAARTGLSDSMSPGSITNLTRSSDVAFRVRFDGPAPPANALYWRGPVLRDFDGRTWSAGRSATVRTAVVPTAAPVEYEITLEPHQRRWIFALDLADPTALPRYAVMTSDYQLLSRRKIDRVTRYRLRSHPDYVADPNPPRWLLGRDLALPRDRNPRTQALGRRWRDEGLAPRAIVDQALTMYRAQPFVYTLRPPPLGVQHPADDFLFGTRRGFCEHFASSFTVLMRAAGVPARVVTGYLGGEPNPLGDHVTVRQSEAHAWAEVWQEGLGWTRVDPTGAVAPERIEQSLADALPAGESIPGLALADSAWLRRLQYSLDVLNTRWNDWVLGYGADRQRSFLAWLGMRNPNIGKMILSLTVLVTALLGAIWAWLTWRASPAAPAVWVRDYRKFLAKLRRRDLAPRMHEGPLDFAQRARTACPDIAGDIDAITAAYVALKYLPAPDRQTAATLRQRVRRLRV